MTITTIQLVDTDLSTVLFDLHSSDGSTNSSWGSVITKFGLGGNLTTTAPHDPERFEHPGADGGFTTFSRRGLGEAKWRQFVSGTTEANLRLGVGRLTDLITRGTILRIVTSTTTRYLRLEPSGYPSSFQGKELELHDIFQQFAFRQGLDITAACQPYWEGAEVTAGSATVPMDPVSGTPDVCRTYEFTATGDLPTPGKVRVQQDASSATQRVLVANRALGTNASTDFSNYKADTGAVQLEATGRGWTITLGTDVTTANDGADASPPSATNVARCSYATISGWARRVRATRTTNLDSIRGSWDVWLRAKPSATPSGHDVKLLWGVTSADPPANANEPVTITLTSGITSFAYYTEHHMGRIYVPTDRNIALSALTFDLYAQRTFGSGNLDLDFLWLTPANDTAELVVPDGGSSVAFTGGSLLTPVTSPAGGTAGSVVGTYLLLDTTTDNAGVGVAGGTVVAAGRWRSTFRLKNISPSVSVTVDTGIRIVAGAGAGTYASALVSRNLGIGATVDYAQEWDANGTSAYQEQVDNPSVALLVEIYKITREFIPSLAVNESARTNPRGSSVERLDTSGNYAGELAVEGVVPMAVQPGTNHVMIRVDSVADGESAGYSRQSIARTPTVTVAYYPRFAL